MKKATVLTVILLLALIVIQPMQASLSVSQTVPSSGIINIEKKISKGINYLSLYHMYNINNDVLNRDFSKFIEDGIDTISLSLYWYRLEGHNRGDYNGTYEDGTPYGDTFLSNIKNILTLAAEKEIKVLITFHTLWGQDSKWCTPNYVRDPISGEDKGLAIVRSDDMKKAFIDMFKHTVEYLKDSPGIWAWAILNEPWYWGSYSNEHDFITSNGQTQKENFISLIEELSDIVKVEDGRPVTVRFVNVHANLDNTGTITSLKNIFVNDWEWDQRIFDALDFIGLNAYIATGISDTLKTTLLEMTVQNILGCSERNKEIWITEFGSNSDDDTIQSDDYLQALEIYQDLPLKGIISWFWRSDSSSSNPGLPGKGWNLCADAKTGKGRPAYYNLIEW